MFNKKIIIVEQKINSLSIDSDIYPTYCHTRTVNIHNLLSNIEIVNIFWGTGGHQSSFSRGGPPGKCPVAYSQSATKLVYS